MDLTRFKLVLAFVVGTVFFSVQSAEAASCTYEEFGQTDRVCRNLTADPSFLNRLNDECFAVCSDSGANRTDCQVNQSANCPGTTTIASSTPTTTVNIRIIELTNPLGLKLKDKEAATFVPEIIGTFISNALGLIGTLTLVVFIYGGFMWLTSGGSEERISKGAHAMVYAAIGICIIFSSYAILQLVFQAFR